MRRSYKTKIVNYNFKGKKNRYSFLNKKRSKIKEVICVSKFCFKIYCDFVQNNYYVHYLQKQTATEKTNKKQINTRRERVMHCWNQTGTYNIRQSASIISRTIGFNLFPKRWPFLLSERFIMSTRKQDIVYFYPQQFSNITRFIILRITLLKLGK